MVAELIDNQLRAANEKGYTIEKVMVGGWYKDDLIADVIAQTGNDVKISAVTEIYGVPVIEIAPEVFRVQLMQIETIDE